MSALAFSLQWMDVQGTTAMGVPFISQTHTDLHKIVQMGTDILNFLALSLRTAEEILSLHKSVPVCIALNLTWESPCKYTYSWAHTMVLAKA